DRRHVDETRAGRAVEFGTEGDRLALVGIGAGEFAGRLGVGEIFGDDAQALGLRAEAGCRHLERGNQGIHVDQLRVVIISMRWKDLMIAVLGSKARRTSPAVVSWVSSSAVLPDGMIG